jgi:hypothetical protein
MKLANAIKFDRKSGGSPTIALMIILSNSTWVPHISLVFREMWDTTDLHQ